MGDTRSRPGGPRGAAATGARWATLLLLLALLAGVPGGADAARAAAAEPALLRVVGVAEFGTGLYREPRKLPYLQIARLTNYALVEDTGDVVVADGSTWGKVREHGPGTGRVGYVLYQFLTPERVLSGVEVPTQRDDLRRVLGAGAFGQRLFAEPRAMPYLTTAILRQGALVAELWSVVRVDGARWLRVHDPASGRDGYIRADSVVPVPASTP